MDSEWARGKLLLLCSCLVTRSIRKMTRVEFGNRLMMGSKGKRVKSHKF